MTTPPPEIPGYRVLGPVGAPIPGRPNGAVFLAEPSDRPDTRVVIKDYLLWIGPDPRRVEGAKVRLNRSWVAARSVDHPGIVRPLQRIADRWLVLEWIDGPSLAARMAAGPVPRAEAWDLILAIAEALAALTAALDRRFPDRPGMGHGDLHAHNILLPRGAAAGTVKLVDLDKVGKPCNRYQPLPAARRGEILRAGRSIATPPEICLGTVAMHDGCVDVFALGVLAWRLLDGQYPFERPEEFLEKLDRLQGDGTDASARLPARVAAAPATPRVAVLARMLRLDRAGRFPSVAAALAELCRVREA
ncbi:MAG: hypothetical protein U1E14_19010 [Geminicoccaceae bacterium]